MTERANARQRACTLRRKQKTIEAYGGRCACCGEERLFFLTIDHKNGNGASHRRLVGRGTRFYQWLVKNRFPKGFQVMCYCCNSAKGTKKKCPCRGERLRYAIN